MKRRIAIFLGLFVMTALAGCGAKEADSEINTEVSQEVSIDVEVEKPAGNDAVQSDAESEGQETEEASQITDMSSDVLVVYFSRTGEQYGVGVIDKGNTAIVAEMIAEETGADTYEILPAEDYYPYTYDELCDVAKQELNDNAKPEIKGSLPDLSGYQTIFIGAPVWWGDWPMIMYTFFEGESDGLAGKTLIPFSTHAGSGLSGFDKKLAEACPESVVGTGVEFRVLSDMVGACIR